MTVTYREPRLPEEWAPIAALVSAARHETVTADQMARQVEHLGAGAYSYSLIAEVDGRVAAYGWLFRWQCMRRAMLQLRLTTHPDFRRQGIGTQLHGLLEQAARTQGCNLLRGLVKEGDEPSLAFARARGHAVSHQLYVSRVDLTAFDDAAFAGVVDAVRAGGIRFFTLADEPGEHTERALYALCQTAMRDNPSDEDELGSEPFEGWRESVLGAGSCPQECVVVAADGNRIVSATFLRPNREKGTMYNLATMTDAAYRGRNLALAVKLVGVEVARRRLSTCLVTDNDSQNAPMLAINRKMGYQPLPGTYLVDKALV